MAYNKPFVLELFDYGCCYVVASDDTRRPVGPDAKYVIKVVSCIM